MEMHFTLLKDLAKIQKFFLCLSNVKFLFFVIFYVKIQILSWFGLRIGKSSLFTEILQSELMYFRTIHSWVIRYFLDNQDIFFCK